MASEALQLIQAVSEEGERWSAGTWTSTAITRHLMGAIATAVQRGNAMALLSGYTRAARINAATEKSGAGNEKEENGGEEADKE